MGRHRRSGAARAAATPDRRPATVSHRRRGGVGAPLRTGLLGVSAAVAMGAVAVATGVLPGTDGYRLGGSDGSGEVRSASAPAEVAAQGGSGGGAERGEPSPSRSTDRSRGPEPAPSKAAPKPSRTPSEKPAGKPSAKPSQKPSSRAPKPEDARTPTAAPSRKPTEPPARKPRVPAPRVPSTSGESAAEAEVLTLVNVERAKAGCRPVTADGRLAALAGRFSEDMAERGFFDHTDPDGATPWDRAEKAGITNLGGENIARGQADARAVMAAWMGSPGHRANILNCDYRTMGVGAHFAPGGPWWTQDFGF
ncbi:CAP domain-containing protein [Streptomyces sp. NPDC005898]|uniref:CAP domain-containing protein n=1 Tax=Streptomyces sp. NPDC005898 TaxID=3157082 RepID=UPI0033FA8BD9